MEKIITIIFRLFSFPFYLVMVYIILHRNLIIHAWNFLIYGGSIIAHDKKVTRKVIDEAIEASESAPDPGEFEVRVETADGQIETIKPESSKPSFHNFR